MRLLNHGDVTQVKSNKNKPRNSCTCVSSSVCKGDTKKIALKILREIGTITNDKYATVPAQKKITWTGFQLTPGQVEVEIRE